MNLLQIGTFDIEGGVARAAYRLFKGIQMQENIHSTMFVQNKKSMEYL